MSAKDSFEEVLSSIEVLDDEELPFDVEEEKPTPYESLDDFLSSLDEETYDEENTAFVIETESQANYFLRKVKEAEEEKKRIKQEAKDYLADVKLKVSKWEEQMLNSEENNIERCMNLLEDYASKNLDKGKKSVKLIDGMLQFKKQQPLYTYEDNILLEEVKKKHKDLLRIKTTESVDKKELRKQIKLVEGKPTIDGKEVKGVQIESRPDQFSVKY